MTMMKKRANGEYYLANQRGTGRDWWSIKIDSRGRYVINAISPVYFPENMKGKKIRFRIEIINEGEHYDE